ncbi:MAG: hypothetical protein QGI83_07515 [Candidatus Latescibacteria bacterium]|jgi:hypothetical protein|nr:hypothetical protein [Candidatus Latescibacterota bacterium]
MPAGISHAVVAPATLAQRGVPEAGQQDQKAREPAASAGTENSQAVLKASRDELVQSPEPKVGAQYAENELAAGAAGNTGPGGSEPARNPEASQPVPPSPKGLGVGEGIDVIG